MENSVVQILPKRYIKTIALEQFVNARPEEFGTQWSYEIKRDNKISFSAKRMLIEAEIQEIQKKSYPAMFSREDVFESD